MDEAPVVDSSRPRRKHRVLLWVGITLLALVIATVAALEVLIRRTEPILRSRIIDTLSTRFKSRVELGSFQVSLLRGLEVSGRDLAIYPYNLNSSSPTFSVKSFFFRADYGNLLRRPMEIGRVDVNGLRINLPPKSQRKQMPKLASGNGKPGKIDFFVDEIRATDATLILNSDRPGKLPLEFDIQNLVLKSVGTGKPLDFIATLTNPKPVGNIQSNGYFGPWDTEDPGSTPLSGTYSFTHADLSTLKGIGGILSSTGRYQGSLDNIVVNGETDTPDFELDISGHKAPLHTDFHAIVDGSDGDTYLQPVIAHLLHSSFTANGYVVRAKGTPGHDIHLDVVMKQANIQDMLWLGVSTDPPVMNGQLQMHTTLDLPPGKEDVARRLKLQGGFAIANARFNNSKIQSGVDQLSLRGQGQPRQAQEEAHNMQTANIGSHMQGNFNLLHGTLSVANLVYDVPGAKIKLDGVYSLDGKKFDFSGTASMDATISQMVGGWKGLLLSPVDRYFKKNGAGTQVPIKITGTEGDLHFGLDFGGHHKQDQQQPGK